MRQRRAQAFRPGTNANHRTQAASYITFCIKYGLRDVNPTPRTICWYLEYMTSSVSSPRTLRNYLSGIKFWHRRIAGEPTALDAPEVRHMLRALDITLRHTPAPKHPITQDILQELVHVSPDLNALGPAFKVAILFGYYGFLRQSNLAPRTPATFNPQRDICRGDVLENAPGLIVILRWSKTLQRGEKAHLVPLPHRPGHPLCPTQAYQDLLRITPTESPNHPILQVQAPTGAPLKTES